MEQVFHCQGGRMTESAQTPARGKMPPVFVISLARATERRAAIAQRLNAEGIKFEFVDAVDGAKINAADYADRFKEQEHTGYEKLSMGELGCYLSHYNLWERIAREKIPYALILEDDAVWDEDFARVACDIVASEWDWDVVLLRSRIRRGASRLFGSLAGGKYQFRQCTRHALDAVAYCITDSAAKRLRAALYEVRDPVDVAWRYYWRWSGRFYTVYPPVAFVSGATSFIESVSAETQTKRYGKLRLSLYKKMQKALFGKKRRALNWWYFFTCRPRKKARSAPTK